MRKVIFSLIILLTNLMALDKVTITTGEWYPWISKKLKKDGVIIDIVRTAFKTQGIKTEFKFYPWKRAYELAQIGRADASVIWFKNKDREKDFLYPKEPIMVTQDLIIYKRGKNIVFNNFDDLKKYTVALTRGYSYGKIIDNMVKNKQLKVKWVDNDLLALKQIEKRNNFDIFICTESVALTLIAKNFEDPSIFEFHSKTINKSPQYFIISKKSKHKEEILKAFNKGLEELKSKGLIKKMITNSYQGAYIK